MMQNIYTQDIDAIRNQFWNNNTIQLQKKIPDVEFKPFHLKMFQKNLNTFNVKLQGRSKTREKINYETVVSSDLETCLQNLSKTEKKNWKQLESFQRTQCIIQYVTAQINSGTYDTSYATPLQNFLLDKLESQELKPSMIDFDGYQKKIKNIKNLVFQDGDFHFLKKTRNKPKNDKARLMKIFGGK